MTCRVSELRVSSSSALRAPPDSSTCGRCLWPEVVSTAAGSHGALGRWLARVCRAVWTRREVGLVRGSAVTQAGTVRAVDSPETMGCSGGSKEWLWEVDGDRGNNR